MANEMVVAGHGEIQPVDFQQLRALAKDAADSKFFGAANQSQALMIMMTGRDLGLSYTQSLRMFHIIMGKPTISADGAVAVCLAHPEVCEYFRTVELDDTHALVETKRKGYEPRQIRFTIDDAARAGLLDKKDSLWYKYPSRLCLARARIFLAREVYPDILAGLLEEHEAPEAARPRDVVYERVQQPVRADEAQVSPKDQEGPVSRPQVVDAETEEDDGATLFSTLRTRIAEAPDRASLNGIAGEIDLVKDQLTDNDRHILRADWKMRLEALKGAA